MSDALPESDTCSRLAVRVISSIDAVDREQWDALVGETGFFHSHRWLSALDDALGEGEYLVVDGSAGLMGGVALWDPASDVDLFHAPTLFAQLPGPWSDPFLWLGARRATHNEIPSVQGGDRPAVHASLLDAALELARERGRVGIVFPYVPLAHAMEIASAHAGAHVLLHSAQASLAVPPGGLCAALARWRAPARRQAKAELAAFERFGNRLEWHPFDEALEQEAARLVALNRGKYGNAQGQAWMKQMFAAQRRSGVAGQAVAALARRPNGISAMAIYYRFGRVLYGRYFGSDYEISDNDFRYFVLSYYAPLDYAATAGITHCQLSISALEAKARRGATIDALAAVVAFSERRLLDRNAVARHNGAFASMMRARFGPRLGNEWSLIGH